MKPLTDFIPLLLLHTARSAEKASFPVVVRPGDNVGVEQVFRTIQVRHIRRIIVRYLFELEHFATPFFVGYKT